MLKNFVAFLCSKALCRFYVIIQLCKQKVKAATSDSSAEFKDHQAANSGSSEGMS